MKVHTLFLVTFILFGCGFVMAKSSTPTVYTNASGLQDFSVDFSDCVESIGVGLVSTDNARRYVPAEFILAGEGQPVTPLVVRTARCRISIDGHNDGIGRIVQIGAVIVPPDFTGDINNYTMFYYTDDLRLALRLNLAGVFAQFDPRIVYDYDNSSTLFVRVPLPGIPTLTLSGNVTPSPVSAGSFTANWWQTTFAGPVKMSTNVPVIFIGSADQTLITRTDGLLGQLIGGSTMGFPIIQQFNTFASAQMDVSGAQ